MNTECGFQCNNTGVSQFQYTTDTSCHESTQSNPYVLQNDETTQSTYGSSSGYNTMQSQIPNGFGMSNVGGGTGGMPQNIPSNMTPAPQPACDMLNNVNNQCNFGNQSVGMFNQMGVPGAINMNQQSTGNYGSPGMAQQNMDMGISQPNAGVYLGGYYNNSPRVYQQLQMQMGLLQSTMQAMYLQMSTMYNNSSQPNTCYQSAQSNYMYGMPYGNQMAGIQQQHAMPDKTNHSVPQQGGYNKPGRKNRGTKRDMGFKKNIMIQPVSAHSAEPGRLQDSSMNKRQGILEEGIQNKVHMKKLQSKSQISHHGQEDNQSDPKPVRTRKSKQ